MRTESDRRLVPAVAYMVGPSANRPSSHRAWYSAVIPRRRPLNTLVISGFLSVLFVGHGAGLAATARTGSVDRPSVHYVAINGSDAGSGTADQPWATINHAAEQAQAGDKIIIRGGHYMLPAQVQVRNSGRPDAWIVFAGYPGEKPILDAQTVARSSMFHGRPVIQGFDNGAFQIEGVSYIRIENLSLVHSQDAGFTVRDSSNIDLINNLTRETFSSGIAAWDTNHQGNTTRHIRIIGNKIEKPTSWDAASPDEPRSDVAPQEALSIAGAVDFEVAYNKVYDSDEGGIDIKETSKQGKVHHNFVHGVGLGIYVDAWFGTLSDVKIFSNVVEHCKTAGIAVAVEQGQAVSNIDIHRNLVFNNLGSGLYFPRWGANSERTNIQVRNNTFYHNGYGPPSDHQELYWMTGGLYLYSSNLRDITVKNNIFSKNRAFQIGYSELYLQDSETWQRAAREKNIVITKNLIDQVDAAASPIESGGAPIDKVKIYPVSGEHAIFGDPKFKDPTADDFTLQSGSPAVVGGVAVGAYPFRAKANLWWNQ